jgi:hypothetical protein
MKKLIILILCFSFTIKGTFGQTPNNNFFNQNQNYIYSALVIGGIFAYLAISKHKENNVTPSINKASIRKSDKESIKIYKQKVNELSEVFNSNNLLRDSSIIKSSFTNIHYLYSSSYDDLFNKKTAKYKTIFDNLKSKYSSFIYNTYFPEYTKEKIKFDSILPVNPIIAKDNLKKINQLKYQLCWETWEPNDNINIAGEVDKLNETISIYEQYQINLNEIKKQINNKPLENLVYPDFDKVSSLISKWQSYTNFSVHSMLTQMNDLKCQYYKNLYVNITAEANKLFNTNVDIYTLNKFNNSVEYITYRIKEVNVESCVSLDSFNILLKKVNSKSEIENNKIKKFLADKQKNDSLELVEAYRNSPAGQIQKLHPSYTKEDCENIANIWKLHPNWSEYTCEDIAHGMIWIGMTLDMLKCERGNPDSANPSNYGYGVHWQWCWYDYKPSCFYGGSDGIITSYN